MTQRATIFLSGQSMHPTSVREQWHGARFVARARITAARTDVNPVFSSALEGSDGAVTVWGIAVEVPGKVDGETRSGTIDAGDALELTLTELPLLSGPAESVLAAALYWELDTGYTGRLRVAAGVAAPAAEGGWESPVLEAEPPPS